MKKIIKILLRKLLKWKGENTIFTGKNKGFKFIYAEDLNLDMMLGVHEPNSFEVFDLFLKQGDVVAEIGANIGYFSKFISQKIGAKGRLICFEPVPYTFNRLELTIKMNSLKQVTLVQAAVSNQTGIMDMYLSHTHYMASLDGTWAGKETGIIKVTTVTLDEYFKELSCFPDFIKMDIEGGGVYALQGMTDCIIKNEPILFLESHTPEEDLAIGKALSLIPYLVYRVGETREVKYLDQNYLNEYGIYGTVIAIPRSKAKRFGNWSPSRFQTNRVGQRQNKF